MSALELSEEQHEKPNLLSLGISAELLLRLNDLGMKPTLVNDFIEGGVGIIFIDGNRYADIEVDNEGDVLVCVSNRVDPPAVWEFNPNKPFPTLQAIKAFMSGDLAQVVQGWKNTPVIVPVETEA